MKIVIPESLKRDSYISGSLIGIILPVVVFALIYGINYLAMPLFRLSAGLSFASVFLLSFVGNLLLLRYYLVNHKLEKSARGLILVTSILVVGFFVLEHFLIIG